MLEWVPFGEAADEFPYLTAVSMEDVGSIVMDADPVFIPVVITIATNVRALVNDSDSKRIAICFMS